MVHIVEKTDFTKYLPGSRHLGFADRGYFQVLERRFDPDVFDVLMPALSKLKVINVIDTNLSRLVTRNRWICEVLYGIIQQQWRIMYWMIYGRNKLYMTSCRENIYAVHNFTQYVFIYILIAAL